MPIDRGSGRNAEAMSKSHGAATGEESAAVNANSSELEIADV